jgi:hypothetical protein
MGLSILILTIATVCAGDNPVIQVSCSIPAVPGLNAPPIEENTANSDLNNMGPSLQANFVNNEISPTIIQEEVITSPQTGTPLLILQTIYRQ